MKKYRIDGTKSVNQENAEAVTQASQGKDVGNRPVFHASTVTQTHPESVTQVPQGNSCTTMKKSEFAAPHGVNRKSATAWKKRGWLVLEGDQVDVEAFNANLKRYRTGATQSLTPLLPAGQQYKVAR